MPALNRVQLIGNLGKDPETRFTAKGNKYCRFTIAVNRRWKGEDGEPQEITDWFNIEAWDRLGEVCQEYLHKGSLVFLEGRMQTNRYEHEGETRVITKVVLQSMQMLDRKGPPEEPEDVIEEEPGIE